MPLSPKLLDIIACPQCKGDLEYKENENRLICDACSLAFRIADDIPVLLIDEAEKL